jgi:hypothetical protein
VLQLSAVTTTAPGVAILKEVSRFAAFEQVRIVAFLEPE